MLILDYKFPVFQIFFFPLHFHDECCILELDICQILRESKSQMCSSFPAKGVEAVLDDAKGIHVLFLNCSQK